eukprot:Skav215999  [mRNA]  locus=scaffold833:19263:21014:+ [translate_table: standard]
MTVGTLTFLLGKLLASVTENRRLRLTQIGHANTDTTELGHCEFSPLHDAAYLCVQVEMTGGGGKTQLRNVHQSALASSLLDRGHALSWVTKSVDKVVSKVSLQKLQTVTGLPPGNKRHTAIDELLRETGIDIPQPLPNSSRLQLQGAPWQKSKKQRLDATQIDVSAYTLVEGFFSNSDGSEVVQIADIRPQSSGLCLMHRAQAHQWIQQANTISSDELAILIPGRCEVPDTLESVSLTCPCYNSQKEMVLLTGTLIQLGVKNVKYRKGTTTDLQASAHLVSLTLYREDWSDSEWARAVDQTAAFIKEKLGQDGIQTEIQSLWGKSMRANGRPASPVQATTVQLHGTIAKGKLSKVLSPAGFNWVWIVPKTPDGRVSLDYKIIWLAGDLARATCLSAQLPDCQGLVRGKSPGNLGLRFANDKHAQAWKVIFPHDAVPKISSGQDVFKIEGLPFGCSAVSLQQWLENIGWTAVPFRALGPNTWLLKSDSEAPSGVHLYNSTPVLIRKLPPRNQQTERVLLGRPSKPQGSDPWQHGKDPWHGYQPTTNALGTAQSVAGPRVLQEPVETRFQSQDEKIQTHRSAEIW